MRVIDSAGRIRQHDILPSDLLALSHCQFAQILYALADFIEFGIEFGIAVTDLFELKLLGHGNCGASTATSCP